jgi:uncharacterized protein YbjQ (UPF0145 family)
MTKQRKLAKWLKTSLGHISQTWIPDLREKIYDNKMLGHFLDSLKPGSASDDEAEDWVDVDSAPVVTQQPTLGGDAGQAIEIVMSEVISVDSDEKGLFHGLGRFLLAERPQDYTAADGVLLKLLSELQKKARHLEADAVVSTTIKSVRGVDDSGKPRIKMTAIGTAIRLKGMNS